MATLTTQPYKGTRDFYPKDMRLRTWIFDRWREVCESYGYGAYDGPMLESFELYAAKTGEEIVNQQLYWMVDRGDRKVALRPEMTPTLARMVAGKIHELPRPVRLYSIPNVWRYERPQKGRLREFWQLNVDVFGGNPVLADAEILSLSLDLMKRVGGEKHVSIRLNNRRLMDAFFRDRLKLSPEATLKVTKLIDARAKIGEDVFKEKVLELGLSQDQFQALDRFFKATFQEIEKDLAGASGLDELSQLFSLLRETGRADQVTFDPTVLRGLDYYTGTVFEMYDISPENRRAMFGGGRYDNLLDLFGNQKLPGVGMGMGDVTFRDFLETHGLLPVFAPAIDVFVSLPAREFRVPADRIATDLRAAGLKVMSPLEEGGFGAQLKLAVKHEARFAVLFGETEFREGKVLLKNLEKNEQSTVAIQELATAIGKAAPTV